MYGPSYQNYYWNQQKHQQRKDASLHHYNFNFAVDERLIEFLFSNHCSKDQVILVHTDMANVAAEYVIN